MKTVETITIAANSRQGSLNVEICLESISLGNTEYQAIRDALLCELSSVLDTYDFTIGMKGTQRKVTKDAEVEAIGFREV